MEQQIKPRLEFTFPIRWLNDKEERKFLHENLLKAAQRSQSSTPVHPKLLARPISGYWAVVRCHAYSPTKVKLTAKDIEKALKPMFPYARCMVLEHKFVQEESQTLLPVMELQIIY